MHESQVEGARRGLALLLGIMLSLAWAPAVDRILLHIAPEAYLASSQFSDIFTEEQLDFIAKVWNSERLYVIYDKYGRAWVVGQGRLPEPLAQQLNSVAQAQITKTWRFEFESVSTTGYTVVARVTGWPENPQSNTHYRYGWGWTAFADDPFDDDGDSYGVAAGVWPAYVVVKHTSSYNWELHKIMLVIVDGGYIKAWSQGVEVSLNIIFHIYIADLYPGTFHPNIVRWRMCPEFPDPLQNSSSKLIDTPQWVHTQLVKNTDPNYIPPSVENIRHGVDGNGCLFIEVDMNPSSYTDPNTGRTTTYNSYWHHNNAKIQYLEFKVSFNVRYGFPGQGQLEYSYEQGSGGGGGSGGSAGPEQPGADQPQQVEQCVVQDINAVAPLVGIAGMVGGIEGTPVDWIVFKNEAAPWPNGTDLRNYERVAWGYAWLGVQPSTCAIQGERGADLSLNEYSFTLDYGLGPGFWHAETLPVIAEDPQSVQSKNYYFAWYVLLEWSKEQDLNNDGRVDPWEVVRYRSTRVYYVGPFPVLNTPETQSNVVVSMIANALKGALSSFFYFLKSLIPDSIEQPLGYLLGFFKDLLLVIVDFVRVLYRNPWVLDLLSVLLQLMPVFLIAYLAQDPMRAFELIRKLISLISAIVQAIRAALPLP